MKRRACLLASVLLLALGACEMLTGPSGGPTIEGWIGARDVPMSIAASTTVHVQEGAEDPCGIVFAVSRRTQIVQVDEAGRQRSASTSDLVVGRRVRVRATSAIMDSCPGQAGALAIEILPD